MTGSEVNIVLNSWLSLSTLYTNEVVFMPQLKSGKTYLSIWYRWEKMEDCHPEPARHLSQSLLYPGGPGQGRAEQAGDQRSRYVWGTMYLVWLIYMEWEVWGSQSASSAQSNGGNRPVLKLPLSTVLCPEWSVCPSQLRAYLTLYPPEGHYGPDKVYCFGWGGAVGLP